VKDLISYIKTEHGYSASRIKSLSQKTISELKEYNKHLNSDSIAEHLYNLENNIRELPKCKVCGKEHNKFKYKSGYSETCSSECSVILNTPKRTTELKEYFYKELTSRFISNDEYEINIPKDDYLNGNGIIQFKHRSCSHKYDRSIKYQGHFNCPKCYLNKSKVQYDIYEWLNKLVPCEYNDRQIIKPLELDIVCKNVAIEYDGMMFHSFGISNYDLFNNTKEDKHIHSRKTDLVNSQDMILLRIFSTEWKHKQDICFLVGMM